MLDSASSMETAHTLEDVRQYWNEYVNDIEVTDLPVGSAEFFDALEKYRYDKIDYLRSYVDFTTRAIVFLLNSLPKAL